MGNKFLTVIRKPYDAVVDSIRRQRIKKNTEKLVENHSNRLGRPVTFGDILLETEPRHSKDDFKVVRAQVTPKEEEHLTEALMNALQYSPFDRIKGLIEQGANPGKPDIDGKTPLMRAVYKYHGRAFDVFNLLKANGADLDAADNNGDTVLMWAVYASHESACRWIFENRSDNFDVNAKNKEGKTALDLAYEHQTGMQDYLISIGGKRSTAS